VPAVSQNSGSAQCSFSSAHCVLQLAVKESAGLQDLVLNLFGSGFKWDSPFHCLPNHSGWPEGELPKAEIPTSNEETFALKARAGLHCIRQELAELVLNSQGLRREDRSLKVHPGTTQFIHRCVEGGDEDAFANDMQVAAADFADKKLDSVVIRLRQIIGQCNSRSRRLPILHHALGIALMESGDLPRARRELLTALVLMRSTPQEPLRSDILDDLGMVHLYQGKLDASHRAHRRALKRNIHLSDQRRVARSCEHLGLVAWKQGRAEAALGWLLISLSLRCPLGFAIDLADSMDSLGRICTSMKFYSVAFQLHRQALGHRSLVGDEHATAKTWTNLGVMFRKLGQLRSAFFCHSRAMKIRSHYQDRIGIANSHNNLGVVLMKLGFVKAARKEMRKALRLRHEMGDSLNLSRNLANLKMIEKALHAKTRVPGTPRDKAGKAFLT